MVSVHVLSVVDHGFKLQSGLQNWYLPLLRAASSFKR